MEQRDILVHNELFILLPESAPTQYFTIKVRACQTEEEINQYLSRLELFFNEISIEKYIGFYDHKNIDNFLRDFDVLEDLYLITPRAILRSLLKKECESWREEHKSIPDDEYKIKSTPSRDNSFGEIHSRITENSENGYLLISHDAIHFQNQFVEIEHSTTKQKEKVECRELDNAREWFVNNRKPRRIYHPSPKHGEKGKGEWKIKGASKLLCSHLEAETMLHKAVGLSNIDELYYFDKNHERYIIFRNEGEIGEEKYHAYHLDVNTPINRDIIKLINLAYYQ